MPSASHMKLHHKMSPPSESCLISLLLLTLQRTLTPWVVQMKYNHSILSGRSSGGVAARQLAISLSAAAETFSVTLTRARLIGAAGYRSST